MTGQLCPDCGTPRAAEDRPGCDCAERGARSAATAESVRATRSEENAVENAAAEDFDPLRIRPYVTLDTGRDTPRTFRTAGPLPPLAPASGSTEPPAPAVAAENPPAPPPVRRKPYRAVVIGAAAVAVIGTAAFAGGLFSQDNGEERARPDKARTWLPSMSPEKPGTSSPPATPAPTASATPSKPAPPPPPAPSASPPTGAKAPSPAASKSTGGPLRQSDPAPAGGSLGPGDTGPEVVELQRRLAELRLFHGSADGRYDQRVVSAVSRYQSYKKIDDDPQGVYGPHTRRALEADTGGAGRRH